MFEISPHSLNLSVTVPPSKSCLHRAIICNALAGRSMPVSYNSEDIKATQRCVRAILSDYSEKTDKKNQGFTLDCGESASTLRFLIPVMCAISEKNTFLFSPSLGRRGTEAYFPIFEKQGIKYKITETSLETEGKLTFGEYIIDGSLSAQYVTGLLLALPLLSGDSKISVEGGLVSAPYTDLTLEIMKQFGIYAEKGDPFSYFVRGNQKYQKCDYTPEGDWSSGAFWYFLREKHNIVIKGLNDKSFQPDSRVKVILPNLPKVFSVRDCPDLAPCLTAYAISTGQPLTIEDAGRLKYKECDRLNAMNEFRKLGADIKTEENRIIIGKNHNLRSGYVRSFSDHRMLMAWTVFAYLTGLTVFTDSKECINKSYPNLFDILEN